MHVKVLIHFTCVLITIMCHATPPTENSQNYISGLLLPANAVKNVNEQRPLETMQIENNDVPAPQDVLKSNEQPQTLLTNSNSNQLPMNYNQYQQPVYNNLQQDLGNQQARLSQQLPLTNQQILIPNQQMPANYQQAILKNQPLLVNQQQLSNKQANLPSQIQILVPQNQENQQQMLISQIPQSNQAMLIQRPNSQGAQQTFAILIPKPVNQQIQPNQAILVQNPNNVQPQQNQAIIVQRPEYQQTLLVPQQQNQHLSNQNVQLGQTIPNNQIFTVVPLNGQNVGSNNLGNSNTYLIPIQQIPSNK